MNAAPADLLPALEKTVLGQREAIKMVVLAVVAGAHVLLEGVPGVAKTLLCSALAAAIDCSHKRVQFTSDMMPSDILGVRVFDRREQRFTTLLGPIFSNVVLADEINRAPARVQSALLEAMNDRRVTIADQTHDLPDPFMVLATRNPIDSFGTFEMPDAQLDRFWSCTRMDLPTRDEEALLLERRTDRAGALPQAIARLDDVRRWQRDCADVFIAPEIRRYIVDLVAATRNPPEYAGIVLAGAGPRASLALAALARASALLEMRDRVLPQDVRAIAPAVLGHRLRLAHDSAQKMRGADVAREIVHGIPAP